MNNPPSTHDANSSEYADVRPEGSNVEQVAQININLLEEFTSSISLHLESMRTMLESIERGTVLSSRARSTAYSPSIEFSQSDVAGKQWRIQRAIDAGFLSIVRSAIDLMDLVIGLKEIVEKGLEVKRDIVSYDELMEYFREELSNNSVQVGRDRKLSNPDKVSRIGSLTPFLEKSIIGMIEARRVIEHHKSAVERDFDFCTWRLHLVVDGRLETRQFPFNLDQGQMVGAVVMERVQQIGAGQHIALSEIDVDEAAFTLTHGIAPTWIWSLGPKTHANPGVLGPKIEFQLVEVPSNDQDSGEYLQ